MRTACVSLLLVLAGLPAIWAQRPATLSGCLSGEPGNYVLGAVPSGNLYRVQADPTLLAGYNHRLIRVTGTETVSASSSQTGTVQARQIEEIADTCTTPLPSSHNSRPVTGKTAERSVAVNTSSTASVGENTPGWQTETGRGQQPGRRDHATSPGQVRPGPLAPPVWAQAGQAPQEGNLDAAAAERAEEYPANTLGVNAVPDYTNPRQAQGTPATRK